MSKLLELFKSRLISDDLLTKFRKEKRMKSILFRSIGVSLFLVCLTFSTFADEGEMGTGSKTGNGGGLAPTTVEINTKTDDSTKVSEMDFFGWLAEFFTDVLS